MPGRLAFDHAFAPCASAWHKSSYETAGANISELAEALFEIFEYGVGF